MICKFCLKEMYLEESENQYISEYNYYICEKCESSCSVTTYSGGDEEVNWC